MHPDIDVDVAVIGYGPTGLVAASLLGRAGHRVLVVERWPNLYGLPRFTHIDGETARTVSAAADVRAALQDSGPTSLTYQNAAGEVLIHIPASVQGPHGFAEHLSIHQPDVEQALDTAVRDCPSVEVRRGWALTGLTQDEDGVTLQLTRFDAEHGHADDADVTTVRARWVIAADGSRSAVRELLGVDRDDLGFNERWVNYDAEWTGPVPERFHDTVQTCDPARGHMTMRIGGRRQRFEFACLPGETDTLVQDPATAAELLQRHYDVGPDDVRLLRRVVYTFEARIARQWQVGRVFLAGDAAHTMPPYLGQGACSGIRDAANLSWKLDLVLRGVAPRALLESYETERRPHATALVHGSVELGRVANTNDPQAAAGRDAAFRAGQVPPPPAGLPPLLAGVLQPGADGTPVPPVGTLAPQGELTLHGRTGLLTELVGARFLLVAREQPELTVAQQAFLDAIGARVLVLAGTGDRVLTGYLTGIGADVALVRPDFVLFGAAPAAGAGAVVDALAAAVSRAGVLDGVPA